jgi:Fur family peroxide stress response transcriptional regulator
LRLSSREEHILGKHNHSRERRHAGKREWANPLVRGLQRSGAKITAQRLAICEWLYESDLHPTAHDVHDALHEAFPTMSLATVYNTLSLLERLDLIHEVGRAEDGSVRYDPDTRQHINLVCRRCGRIIDLPLVDLAEIEHLTQAHGFQMDDISLVVHGTCAECQKKDE